MRKLFKGLKRSRQQLGEAVSALVLGKKQIDQSVFDALETQLLTADIGIETTEKVLAALTKASQRGALSDADALISLLKEQLVAILKPLEQPIDLASHHPFVLLMVGINGAGKTTSIAKLAHYFQQQKKQVMLAAGDTFRAAAIEQLQVWGERNQVPVVAQHAGADSASVIFDAIQSAKSKNTDVLIADTAGRLHTQSHLMEELKKVKRVAQKCDEGAPHETLLVLDASIGQNGLLQAEAFHEAIGVTGIAVTKLDGTAKGGILFAIADRLQLPIRFIGVGEGLDDLQPFDANAFVDGLFAEDITA